MTTGTELAVHTGGALAVGADQTAWTEQQLAVLRSAGVSEEVTPAELDAFLHECQRTRLDPFSKQIYLIGRYDSQLKRKVFRSQTGIDGYRVVAHRVVREDRTELEYEDTVWCGPDGEWRDVWLAQVPPAAAKVVVYKGGKRYSAVATLAEYAATYPDGNPYPMWRRMPANQLEKCAEAKALRRAFPNDLGGIYTAEEMEQADARDARPAPQEITVEQAAAKMRRNQHADPGAWDTDVPAETAPTTPKPSTHGQRTKLVILVQTKRGINDDTQRHAVASELLGRQVHSFKDLTFTDAHQLIDKLEREPDHIADAEIVGEEPLPTKPNPRDGGGPMLDSALFVPPLGVLIGHAADGDGTVRDQLYILIGDAKTASVLDELSRRMVEARDAGHLTAQDWDALVELGKAAREELTVAASTRQPDEADQSWSHRRLDYMTAAGA